MADEKLKNDIKQSFNLNDYYTVQVDKYVNITDFCNIWMLHITKLINVRTN